MSKRRVGWKEEVVGSKRIRPTVGSSTRVRNKQTRKKMKEEKEGSGMKNGGGVKMQDKRQSRRGTDGGIEKRSSQELKQQRVTDPL